MNESPDLLTRMFANRVVRNIIAVALILYAADSLYNSGKAMVKGFQEGWAAGGRPGDSDQGQR